MTPPDFPLAPSRFPARQLVVRHLQLDCDWNRQRAQNPLRGADKLTANGIRAELTSPVSRENHPPHKGQWSSNEGQITIQNT
jgi:hypothetical protein